MKDDQGKECYGKELIMDWHNCNPERFTRENIKLFYLDLCQRIDMEMGTRFFWDYKDDEEEYDKAPDHLKGTTSSTGGVQFIMTSNITIHTLDVLKKVLCNVFSCKGFDNMKVLMCVEDYFGGHVVNVSEQWRY